MRISLYQLAGAAAALLALGAAACLGLNRPPAVADPPAADPGATASMESALGAVEADLARRVAARQAVVQAVIDGRQSLTQAAAAFQELDLRSETFNWDAFRRFHPGASDEERQRRLVVLHVQSWLLNDPETARAVLPRLEAELQAFLDGSPRLPSAEANGGSPRHGSARATSRAR